MKWYDHDHYKVIWTGHILQHAQYFNMHYHWEYNTYTIPLQSFFLNSKKMAIFHLDRYQYYPAISGDFIWNGTILIMSPKHKNILFQDVCSVSLSIRAQWYWVVPAFAACRINMLLDYLMQWFYFGLVTTVINYLGSLSR